MIIRFGFKLKIDYNKAMTSAETIYDGFLASLDKALGKIDMELALKVMLYERKMPDVPPSVELQIHYKDNTDISKKVEELRTKYGFGVASYGHNEVFAKGNMNLSMIQGISQDPQIEKIEGLASVASY